MSSLFYPPSVTRLYVDNFSDTVKNDPDSFTRFKVLKITHIKNLSSWVWHEYVQVIVRDTSNDKLHRIIVERQIDNDYVIIGMWKPWTEGETPSSGDGDPPLPLPLLSLTFNTPLALSDVAKHIRAVRAVHKAYNVFQANCYWFALSLYTNLYASAGGTATEKKWTWSFYRGMVPTYIFSGDIFIAIPRVQFYRTEIYFVDCFLTTSLSQNISATAFKRDDMLNGKVCKILYGYLHILMVFVTKMFYSDISTIDVKEDSATDTKDVSTNDAKVVPSGNTPASRLLNFTQEIFKGQTSKAEYEEAMVNFPSVSSKFKCCLIHQLNLTQINDAGSYDFKAMLPVSNKDISVFIYCLIRSKGIRKRCFRRSIKNSSQRHLHLNAIAHSYHYNIPFGSLHSTPRKFVPSARSSSMILQ